MKRCFRQPWLDALRSGKFEQGEGKLRTKENKYCCLGVLYEVTGVEWAMTEYFSSYAVKNCQAAKSYDGYNCAGLGDDKRQFGITKDQEIRLWQLNDCEKLSFPQIADWIEKYIPETQD